MPNIEHLELEDLLELTCCLGAGLVRDVGLLDSAVARPRSSGFGQDAYPSLALKAAGLLDSVVNHHALVDGNKRLGWLACVVFLDLNEHETGLDDEGTFSLVMAVAAGDVDLAATERALDVRRRP